MDPVPGTSAEPNENSDNESVADIEDAQHDPIQRIAEDASEDDDEGSYASDDSSDEDLDIGTVAPTWCITTTTGMRPIPFSETDRLLVPFPGEGNPIDFFELLLDNIFLENICKFSNSYAFEVFCKPTLTPKSRIHKWKDLTIEELKRFIGLVLHTKTIRLNRLQDYWKTDWLFNLCFRQCMARDRFMNILRCLYFFKPNTPTNDLMHRIRFVTDFFNDKMHSVYYPQKELSLDEAMVLWRGRLRFRQYIKGKRHKYGIKLYTLTEHQGLILKFHVYAGAEDNEVGGKGHTEKVVLHLLREKLGKGHAVYMDNFYNSFSLASKLLAEKTFCTGTLRLDRKLVPAEVKSTVLRKGETIARYGESVMVAKWKDKRVVTYLSTEFENEMVDFINKRGNVVKKPLPIVKYNAHMSGVDRADQMLSYYPCERKTLRWYKKIFVHVLQMLLLNAHKLYNMHCPKQTFYDFRLNIIRSLLPAPPPKVVEGPAQKRLRQGVHKIVKNTERNASNRIKRKNCRTCWKNKKDAKTTYYCGTCVDKPGLCLGQCFDEYHDAL